MMKTELTGEGHRLITWGFIDIFCRRATGFHRWAKHFILNFFPRKNVPQDGQTRWTKSSS